MERSKLWLSLVPILFFFLVAFWFFTFPLVASSTQKSDTISIQVNVSELTLVDINPTSLGWSAVEPGTAGEMKAIQIENIGSTNITQIWFNNTYPSSYPFGVGNVSKYDAGNFVVIKRNTTNQDYFFPNRVEYNMSKVEIYLSLPSGWSSHGRFRNSSYEYFWAVVPSTNCSDGTFYIGKDPHTQTSTGSTNLAGTCDSLVGTGSNDCRSGSLTSTGDWGWADLYVGPDSGYQNYTVAVSADCTKVMFYHWNMDAPGAGSSTHAKYFSTSTLYPGDWIVANVRVYVPYGVAAGSVQTGTLTVIAQSPSNS